MNDTTISPPQVESSETDTTPKLLFNNNPKTVLEWVLGVIGDHIAIIGAPVKDLWNHAFKVDIMLLGLPEAVFTLKVYAVNDWTDNFKYRVEVSLAKYPQNWVGLDLVTASSVPAVGDIKPKDLLAIQLTKWTLFDSVDSRKTFQTGINEWLTVAPGVVRTYIDKITDQESKYVKNQETWHSICGLLELDPTGGVVTKKVSPGVNLSLVNHPRGVSFTVNTSTGSSIKTLSKLMSAFKVIGEQSGSMEKG